MIAGVSRNSDTPAFFVYYLITDRKYEILEIVEKKSHYYGEFSKHV
jgi:hypothetical protein